MNALASPVATGAKAPGGVDQAAFRNAMAHLGAAVNIITTDGPAGKAGFAASAVCSVTDTPPTLLICLNRSSSVFDTFEANRVLCVNTLASAHEPLSNLFGGKTPVEERFAAAEWRVGTAGVPILKDAIVAFECAVTESVDVGTHRVLFCSVLSLAEGADDEALIYFRRKYHRIGATA